MDKLVTNNLIAGWMAKLDTVEVGFLFCFVF